MSGCDESAPAYDGPMIRYEGPMSRYDGTTSRYHGPMSRWDGNAPAYAGPLSGGGGASSAYDDALSSYMRRVPGSLARSRRCALSYRKVQMVATLPRLASLFAKEPQP